MFKKVLVANRGEIAVRIIRALRELGIASVAVYSATDRTALHVRLADEAASVSTYLNIESILAAARLHAVDAIHPGYGFLSENHVFAAACIGANLVFIGPAPESIRVLGSKMSARKLAIASNTPTVPGTEDPVSDLGQAQSVAREIGYPVMLKASAGGGGKGMRRVENEEGLETAIRETSGEAERSFGNASIYLEKAVVNPRHIEIQIFGDHHGNLIHLGERECSLQRRHQKVVEECPSPLVALHPEMRSAMGEAALRVARQAGYYNAGTAEFLVDQNRNFYFLEMNTRLQVEHPVTELVTGLDLVHLQLRIAAGERLPITQEQVKWNGWAMECRVYAEDPENQFFPSPGKIVHLSEPAGPGIRVDSGVHPGWTVPIDYDPLLAKLAVWGQDRATTIQRMRRAIDEYAVTGIRTNLGFFGEILADAEFQAGNLHTGFIDEFFHRRGPAPGPDPELVAVEALAAKYHASKQRAPLAVASSSRWLISGRDGLLR